MTMLTEEEQIAHADRGPPTITIDEACSKYGIERKKLIGHILRGMYNDPTPVTSTEILDNWQLRLLATNPEVIMSIPYSTATAGDRALVEMQKTLAAFGCSAFGTMTDNEKGCLIVSFRWRDRMVSLEANWNGYAVALAKDKPYTYRTNGSRADYDRKLLEQARVSVCSVLRDWVKGQTTAIECGVLSFEAAFMPHMLLKDGRRVLDAAQQANLLPPAEESNVLQLVSR